MDEPKTRWFFVDDEGNYRGPADLECVSILVEGGVIHSETMMHVEGSEDWEPAKTFFEFPVAATSQTPPPLTSVPPPLPSTPPPLPPPSKPEIRNVIDKTPRRGWREKVSAPLAEHIGDMGEKVMLRMLTRQLPLGGHNGYRIVRNLMFETPTGTTQLDLTVVSAFGIFIVEVKNYQGWIFGGPEQPRWTQSLAGGRKFQFQNPIRQNFKHLAVLSEKTGIPQNLIFPVVAFSNGCWFKTEMPANVMHFTDVPDYIKKFDTIVIKPEQLTEIVETFLSWDEDIDSEKKRNHVRNLKDAHAPASIHDRNVLCPVCGNRMALRRSRTDGHPFWGCTKYPGCKGIREAVE